VLVKQSPVKNVADFDQVPVVIETIPAVFVPCGDVHNLEEKEQNDDYAVLYDTYL